MNEKPRIPFDSWEALNERDLTEAERRVMSPAWRLWQVSLGRMNNYNHAAFRPGELARLVYGKDTKPNRHAVKVQMGILAGIEWIAPVCDTGSTPLCIMVSQQIACRGAGKGRRKDVCGEIAHMDMRETIFHPMDAVSADDTKPQIDAEVVQPADDDKPAEPEHEEWINPQDDEALIYCLGCGPLVDRYTIDELRVIHCETLDRKS